MSKREFEFPFWSYDKWLTTTPDDRAHHAECNCESCHEAHVDYGDYVENAEERSVDYPCCVAELDHKIKMGRYCPHHGASYMDVNNAGQCHECEHERGLLVQAVEVAIMAIRLNDPEELKRTEKNLANTLLAVASRK